MQITNKVMVEFFYLTSTIAPLFVNIIVVRGGTPGLGCIVSGAGWVYCTFIHEREMTAVTIWITSMRKEACRTESPQLVFVVVTCGWAPAVTSLSPRAAVLRAASIDEWKYATGSHWGPSMSLHTSCVFQKQPNEMKFQAVRRVMNFDSGFYFVSLIFSEGSKIRAHGNVFFCFMQQFVD